MLKRKRNNEPPPTDNPIVVKQTKKYNMKKTYKNSQMTLHLHNLSDLNQYNNKEEEEENHVTRTTDVINPECVQKIASAMSNLQYGIVRRDRRYRYTKYKNCFIGSQAIDWLCEGVKGLGSNRERAESVMNVMMNEGIIRHVYDSSELFQDKFVFYVFTDKYTGTKQQFNWRNKLLKTNAYTIKWFNERMK